MPNVLILCAHRPKRSPSQRYRFEQYLPLLEKEGFRFTFSPLLSKRDDKIFYSKGNFPLKALILLKSLFIRLYDVFRFQNYDIIFIQREASFFGHTWIEKRAFLSGAQVIFDFDDSIWLADTSPGNKKWEWMKNPKKFFKNLKYAHLIIAGNRYLAEKAIAVNQRTVIIPTSIDTEHHRPLPERRNKESVTIGWSGSISTIKHFELLLPVLKRLKEKYEDKVAFKIIGQARYSNKELKVDSVAWTEETEVNELNTFDIGIMPLPDDEWAKGKCGLKGLSYMACGVATVMSKVGINQEIISHGNNGFLAENDEQWFELLCRLIDDPQLRTSVGMEGRKTVEQKYSVKANKPYYFTVFKNAASAG